MPIMPEIQTVAANDEAYYAGVLNGGTFYLRAAPALFFGSQLPLGGKRLSTALRFQNVPIPNGVIINSATITVTRFTLEVNTVCRAKIQAEDVDDPAEWPAAKADFETRFSNRTTASVSWDPVPIFQLLISEYTTPDIASVVQELVSSGGWASGQDMAFFIHDDDDLSDSNAHRTIVGYSSNPNNTAKFNVQYADRGRIFGPVMI